MTNTPKPEALKGCPFCGGAARLARAGLDWFVHCEKCFCGTDHMDTPADARDVWNTRASAAPVENEALASLVERLNATEPLGMLSGCMDTVRPINPDGPEPGKKTLMIVRPTVALRAGHSIPLQSKRDWRPVMDNKATPGPWRVVIDDDGNPLSGRPGVFASDELDCGIVHWDGFVQPYWRSARGDKEIHANARLIAAAPDHASIGWAMCVAGGRWEPWGDGRGEFCLNGIRHSTRLDQFGVPEMTDALRAAILKATGEPK